jgi:hypothetical protein
MIRELALHFGERGAGITRDQSGDELCVVASEMMPSVGENHVVVLLVT